MAKKRLQSGIELSGIAPNILLKHVETTAPFLFQGELQTSGDKRAFLEKLRFYKKNLQQLKHIDLAEYFHLCLAAHWATAGTFVPTDVDNQIREGLWKHEQIQRYIDKMARLTMEAWTWDYSQVTNRKSYSQDGKSVMSTHEGTWLSVAIGAYCALRKHQKSALAQEMGECILAELRKEEAILLQLREERDALNFLRAAPLLAHNLGDLDRVIEQWGMEDSDPLYQRVYKLGHRLHSDYSPVLVFAGQVNKEFTAKENHRHMSMRQAKCLRRSHRYLIPVGPFMDDWGKILGDDLQLNPEDKGEIVAALFEGFKRQDQAFGYVRAFRGLVSTLPNEIKSLEPFIPYDLINEIQKGAFSEKAKITKEDFEKQYMLLLTHFRCPITNLIF
jgi:hypothetical protein